MADSFNTTSLPKSGKGPSTSDYLIDISDELATARRLSQAIQLASTSQNIDGTYRDGLEELAMAVTKHIRNAEELIDALPKAEVQS